MEYSDVVNSRSVWQSLYASTTKRSMKEFSQICSQVPQDEVSPCYYNLPTLIYGAYRSSGDTAARKEIIDRVKPICNAAPDSVHRKACIFGYGASLSDELPRSLPAAVRICDAFLTASDNFACSAGLLSLNIEYGRGQEAIGYCMAFASGPIRQGCFRVLFEKVGSYYPSVDGVEKLCPASEVSCRESAELARNGGLHEYF